MNKSLIIFFTLTFSLSVFSQEKLQEKAKKISDEMTTVLSLDEETSKKIYYIQLARFIDAQKIRKLHKGGDKDQMRAELKKMQGKLWHKLKNEVGRDNMKAWNTHKKNKKKLV